MPTYKVTDPSSGKTVRLTGDSAPTERELEEIFKNVGILSSQSLTNKGGRNLVVERNAILKNSPLSEQQRQKLDGIVSQMESNGKKPEDIQFVVNDFKSKYGQDIPPPGNPTSAQKTPGTIEAEVDGIGVLEFPAGTSYEVIQSTVKRVIAESSVAGAQQTNTSPKLPPGWSFSEKSIWWDTTPPGFKEVSEESATGLILFSPSGRRFQWTNSTPLTATDIEQLGRLKTERVDTIKNSPDVSALLHPTPTGHYLGGWGLSLLATFAVSWILSRRRYNRKSEGVRTTSQETELNPASFRRASLGVRRLASTLFLLFTIGGVFIGVMAGGSDFRFTASLGLIMGLLLWVLIRGIDWIVRGFKFGS